MAMNDPAFHVGRADAYRLLSACFYSPQRSLLLEENLCGNLAKLLAVRCPPAAAAAERMDAALRESDDDSLQVAHAALFVGPFGLLAPPYGSVYLEQGGRLMGESTMAASNLYEKAGLTLELQDAPDHIAIELEFIGFLAARSARALRGEEAEAVADLLDLQIEFVLRQLAPWVPALAGAVRKHATDSFYPALADCLEYFIEAEQGVLRNHETGTMVA